MNWFIHSVRNYANFSGRANRREWWIFCFFYWLPLVLLITAEGLLPKSSSGEHLPVVAVGFIVGAIFVFVWGFALLIPLLAVTIRRFHDIGLSGWWWLLTLVPILGGIFHLVCTLIKGRSETNTYGEHPLSWADQKHRDLARQVSSDLELERRSEEFLNQLSSCMGKDARPELLSPEEKDMVTRFYMNWYPLEHAATEARSSVKDSHLIILWCLFVPLCVLWACRALLEQFFGEPLREWFSKIQSRAQQSLERENSMEWVAAISFISFFLVLELKNLLVKSLGHPLPEYVGIAFLWWGLLCAIMFVPCVLAIISKRFYSSDLCKKLLIKKAKANAQKRYSADIQGRAAHDFYTKTAFPAVKKALSSKRSIKDSNVKEAVLQCVKEQVLKVA